MPRVPVLSGLVLLITATVAGSLPAQTPPPPVAEAPPAAPPTPAAPPPAAPVAPPPAAPPVVAAEQVAQAELMGLLGQVVLGPKGTELGRIVNLLADGQGRLRAAVVDVGGFMGVGSRKVAVAWTVFRFAAGDKGPTVSIVIPPERITSWADYIPGRPVAILGASGGEP